MRRGILVMGVRARGSLSSLITVPRWRGGPVGSHELSGTQKLLPSLGFKVADTSWIFFHPYFSSSRRIPSSGHTAAGSGGSWGVPRGVCGWAGQGRFGPGTKFHSREAGGGIRVWFILS